MDFSSDPSLKANLSYISPFFYNLFVFSSILPSLLFLFFICFDGCAPSLDGGIKSPFQRRKPKNTILLKKQVKFTDDLKCSSDPLTTNVEGEKHDAKDFNNDNDPLQGWLVEG